jgi:hypothetical protein
MVPERPGREFGPARRGIVQSEVRESGKETRAGEALGARRRVLHATVARNRAEGAHTPGRWRGGACIHGERSVLVCMPCNCIATRDCRRWFTQR